MNGSVAGADKRFRQPEDTRVSFPVSRKPPCCFQQKDGASPLPLCEIAVVAKPFEFLRKPAGDWVIPADFFRDPLDFIQPGVQTASYFSCRLRAGGQQGGRYIFRILSELL
jgi:hypothetical protein